MGRTELTSAVLSDGFCSVAFSRSLSSASENALPAGRSSSMSRVVARTAFVTSPTAPNTWTQPLITLHQSRLASVLFVSPCR
jgi:hypothetical protein